MEPKILNKDPNLSLFLNKENKDTSRFENRYNTGRSSFHFSSEKFLFLDDFEKSRDSKLDEIIGIISEKTEYDKSRADILLLNQELMLKQLEEIKSQNNRLHDKIDFLTTQNKQLKHILKNNTSDNFLRRIAIAFFIFFATSFILFHLFNYELIKNIWSELGLIVSMIIYLIGYFVGKLYKKAQPNEP